MQTQSETLYTKYYRGVKDLTRSQLPSPGDIPDGVDVPGRGVLEGVHLDVAGLVGLDAGLVEAEVGRVGAAADRPEQAVHVGEGGALFRLHGQIARRTGDLFDLQASDLWGIT